MTALQAAEFRLYPNRKQADSLNQWIGACRWCWNQFLEYEQYLYDKTGRFAFHSELSAKLPEMKRVAGYEWLADVPAIALVDVSRSLDLALRAFLRQRKTDARTRFPRFKKRREMSGQVYLSGQIVGLKPLSAQPGKARGHVKLPKIGLCRIRGGWWPHGRVQAATVRRNGDCWFLSVRYEAEPPRAIPAPERDAQGLDWGLAAHVTDDRGGTIAPPRHLQRAERRLRRLQRAVSRSQKGSNRGSKKIKRLRRHHRQVANQRKDFTHKVSRALIAKASVTAVEDLNLRGMVRNRHLAKSVADSAWSDTLNKMAYKADWHGRTLVKIDRFDRSTGVCPHDGTVVERLSLNVRQWTCSSCGKVHDRDRAAAEVIRQKGREKVGRGTPEPSRSNGTTRVETGVQRRRGRGLRRRSAGHGSANVADSAPQHLVGL